MFLKSKKERFKRVVFLRTMWMKEEKILIRMNSLYRSVDLLNNLTN